MALSSRASGGVPNLFGKAPIGVQTNSMHGDNSDSFDENDLIICDCVDINTDPQFEIGDVVTFRQDISGNGQQSLVTHRIYKVNEDGSCEIKADTAQKTTMFKEFFEGMSESFAADEEGVTTSVGKPKESIHVFIDKNGNIEAYSAKITIEIAMQQNGKTEMLTIKTSSEVKADKIGGDV
jgi:hypothetical protein